MKTHKQTKNVGVPETLNSGFLLIDKPSGITSHDVIDKLRRVTGIRKIGHAGTLDPFATGLLLIAVGRESTRRLGEFVGLDKSYIAKLKFGYVSDTHDIDGVIRKTKFNGSKNHQNTITKNRIENSLNEFRGKIKQTPPMYSAKKIKGKKLYELARKGIVVERDKVDVTVHGIKLLSFDASEQECEIFFSVSSGTYIRSLGHEIGEVLEVGAYLKELKRISIGLYKLEDAVDLDIINSENWQKYLLKP